MAKIIKRSPKLVKNKFVFSLHQSDSREVLIFLRKSFTNIFLTLTDINKKVVFALSAGQCVEKNNRRGKVAPFVIEAMATKIIKVLQAFNIKLITIISVRLG